jgi:hypothetical protein
MPDTWKEALSNSTVLPVRSRLGMLPWISPSARDLEQQHCSQSVRRIHVRPRSWPNFSSIQSYNRG